MKNKLLLGIFLLLGCASFGQQLTFGYDAAGNQIAVYVQIYLLTDHKISPTKTTLQNNPIYKDVKYYPNPVKNELNISSNASFSTPVTTKSKSLVSSFRNSSRTAPPT
ncbi:MAG: hypothetical protein WCH76_00420 [Candidatus Riflemargulisbacteria bacterium]